MDLLQQPPPPPAVEPQLPPGQPDDVDADADMGDIEQHYSILDHWGEAACCFVDPIRVGLAALKDVGMVSLDAGDLVRRVLQNASANYPPPGDTLDYGPPDVDVRPSTGSTQRDDVTSTVLTALQPLLRSMDRRFASIEACLRASDARPPGATSTRQRPAHQPNSDTPHPPNGTRSYATAASTEPSTPTQTKDPHGRAPPQTRPKPKGPAKPARWIVRFGNNPPPELHGRDPLLMARALRTRLAAIPTAAALTVLAVEQTVSGNLILSFTPTSPRRDVEMHIPTIRAALGLGPDVRISPDVPWSKLTLGFVPTRLSQDYSPGYPASYST
ncbi:hypothetical protein WOLCODRAFT_152082 [Wolfiporia cocos MD-104 SS10]|uniref:Uncharacterized protein n=1 Tax=Wolfiporia cocos (strain MD-104) TaxID=742152 RepID=A0A2H3JKH5_WOLCO|nr:hypothetical protein WOLCODRAFT_152082 [Wolfiporia cocos MD-104 SS10]